MNAICRMIFFVGCKDGEKGRSCCCENQFRSTNTEAGVIKLFGLAHRAAHKNDFIPLSTAFADKAIDILKLNY